MLTNLLPGLREFRTPLAVGYVWLITLWLALHNHIPRRGSATGLVADVYKLADAAGRPITLAALSLVAYLIGAMTEVSATRFIGAIRLFSLIRSIRSRRLVLLRIPTVTKQAREALSVFTYARIQNANARPELDRADATDKVAAAILAEGDQLALRLQYDEKQQRMSAAHDRASSEADFRVSMGLALLPLVMVLSHRYSGFLLLSAALPLLLIARGFGRLRVSNAVLLEGVVTGALYPSAIRRFLEMPDLPPYA